MIAAQKLFMEIESLPAEFLPEVYEFVVCLKSKNQTKEKSSAFGCLSKYADPSKIKLEKGAWERKTAKKYTLN